MTCNMQQLPENINFLSASDTLRHVDSKSAEREESKQIYNVSTEDSTVSGDYDLPIQVYSFFLQVVVVLLSSVICVHQFPL